MSTIRPHTVVVKILDRDYQVACPPEQEAELQASARYLDRQMRAIRDGGKVIGVERIAVMAALNISHELVNKKDAAVEAESQEEARRLGERIDDALQRFRQLEI